MEKTNFTQMMRWVKGILPVLIAVFGMSTTSVNAQFSCIQDFIVPLDEECTGTVTVEMVINPNNTSSLIGWFVHLDANTIPSNLSSSLAVDTVYGEGTWMYGLYNAVGQLHCWGRFTTEDKVDPFFVGDTSDVSNDPNTVFNEAIFNQFGTYKLVEYETWEATLGPGTFTPHLWSCWQSTNHANQAFTWPNIGSRSFDSLNFTATRAGYLTIFVASELNTSSSSPVTRVPSFDPVVAIYGKGGFSSSSPCENMIAFGESTFIPNPLAGLGFAGSLENSSLEGAYQDAGDIYAPWLLHEQPIVRLTVKVDAGQQYTIVLTHRNDVSDASLPSLDADVFFLLDPYDAQPATSTQPRRIILGNGVLPVDTSIAYFDFLCGDLSTVMLQNKKTYNQDQYLTGASRANASIILDLLDGGDGDVDPLNNAQLNEIWYSMGQSLVGLDNAAHLPFIDLEYWNLPGAFTALGGTTTDQRGKWLMEFFFADYGFKPMVIENCPTYTVEVSDTYQPYGDCGIDYSGFEQFWNGFNVSGVVTRTFIVNDGGTKTDPDTAKIQLIFRNPTMYDVRLPHYTVNIECDELAGGEVVALSNGNPSPVSTGYPFIASLTGFKDLTPNSPFCNLAAAYQDVAKVTSCGSTFKFRREWTIYDWCRPGTTVIYNQLIKVGDWTVPTLTKGVVTSTMNPFDCNGQVTITGGSATDNCGTASVAVTLFDGTTTLATWTNVTSVTYGNGNGHTKLVPGKTYSVRWVATDLCGNNSEPQTSTITIVDNIAPSCVIDDLRSITLTNFGAEGTNGTLSSVNSRGQAWVTAERLDEGSWDNCGEVVSKKVRRMTATGMSAWADAVSFTCADEGVEVLVELEVTDDSGNKNVCWTHIKPVDKTQPKCFDVGTVTYTCSDVPVGDLSSSSAVWNAFFDDSITLAKVSRVELCNSNLSIVSTEANIDQCGYGWVNRYYRVHRVIDGKEFADTCRMSLVFYEDHDFWVTFPADQAVECGQLAATNVTYSENKCDLITVSTTDETFVATADECYKVFRTYRVINWCEYDGQSEPRVVARRDWNNDAKVGDATTVNVRYTQGVRHIYWDWQNLVTSVGSDADRRDTLLGVGVTTSGSSIVYWETSAPRAYAAATSVNALNYSHYSSNQGFFTYTQHMKVYDNDEPSVVYTAAGQDSFPSYSNVKGTGCPGAVLITASLTDDCTSNAAQLKVDSAFIDAGNDNVGPLARSDRNFDLNVTANITKVGNLVTYSQNLPVGTHRLRIVAKDGCGNVRVSDKVFTVYDAKGPAPVCIEGFAAELMPTGLDGTGRMATVNAIDFVVNKPIDDCSGDVNTFRITRTTTSVAAILAASDLGASLNLTCEDKGQIRVAVVATDAAGNTDFCITTITVQDNVNPCSGSGAIAGLITTEDNNVVSGVEVSLNAASNLVTAVDGGYFFSGLALGGDYSIAPKKDAGYLNGVSTFDLVLISRHILGVTPLNSPYKLIAADVNNSGSITTLDLIQLRKLILSVDTKLANNTSWRFVPANYTFPVPSNPWSATFPEVLNINNLAGSVNGDFVAIKVGDVNNSAVIDVQPRSNATFALNVEDFAIKAGNEYTVNFTSNASDVEGFQMALSYRGLELVDIVEGIAKVENFGTKFTGEGVVLTSWNGTAANGNMFGLVFRATSDSKLSEALSVTSRHMNAEAYNNAGEAMNVALNFNSGAVAEAAFELRQNMPNPFKGETLIGFNLAEASSATLTINDVTGRVLKVVRGDFAKGANQISLNSKDLPASGVLYYTLTAGEYTATKKMIIMD
jgi:hypothetical protein